MESVSNNSYNIKEIEIEKIKCHIYNHNNNKLINLF